MACINEHMNASEGEIELSIIFGLLDELKGIELPKNFGDGYDKRTYNKGFSQEFLNRKTNELCKKLQKIDATKYSIEMQTWWKNHKHQDRERLKREIKNKEKTLSRLNKYEKMLLNENKTSLKGEFTLLNKLMKNIL